MFVYILLNKIALTRTVLPLLLLITLHIHVINKSIVRHQFKLDFLYMLNGELSVFSDILLGIPQGGVLGPLFFLIFIHDGKTISLVNQQIRDLKFNVLPDGSYTFNSTSTCTLYYSRFVNSKQHFCSFAYYLYKVICHHIVQLAIHFRQALPGFEPTRHFYGRPKK